MARRDLGRKGREKWDQGSSWQPWFHFKAAGILGDMLREPLEAMRYGFEAPLVGSAVELARLAGHHAMEARIHMDCPGCMANGREKPGKRPKRDKCNLCDGSRRVKYWTWNMLDCRAEERAPQWLRDCERVEAHERMAREADDVEAECPF